MFKTDENNSQHRAAELAVYLTTHASQVSAYRVARFIHGAQQVAAKARRHSEAMCSDPTHVERWSDPETGEDLRAEKFDQVARELLAILADVNGTPLANIALDFGGDPRGPCARLKIEGVPGDGWASDDGFAIY